MKASTIKTLTKIGMAGSLAALVLPQLAYDKAGMRHGRDRGLGFHIWAGIALVGFSVWHYNTYQPPVWLEDRSPRR